MRRGRIGVREGWEVRSGVNGVELQWVIKSPGWRRTGRGGGASERVRGRRKG